MNTIMMMWSARLPAVILLSSLMSQMKASIFSFFLFSFYLSSQLLFSTLRDDWLHCERESLYVLSVCCVRCVGRRWKSPSAESASNVAVSCGWSSRSACQRQQHHIGRSSIASLISFSFIVIYSSSGSFPELPTFDLLIFIVNFFFFWDFTLSL